MVCLCTIVLVGFCRLHLAVLATLNSPNSNLRGLDNEKSRFKIPENRVSPCLLGNCACTNAKLPSSAQNAAAPQPCKHPRVQIVSRDEESEFVECKECGEIFESSEFKDMNIEERTQDDI